MEDNGLYLLEMLRLFIMIRRPNKLIKQIGITHAIFQAPMAGVTTPEFVAECADAGIVGAIGAGYLNGEETRKFICDVKKLTKAPFMVNLFVPEEIEWHEETKKKANTDLHAIRQSLGITEPEFQRTENEFEQQIDVILEESIAICSFAFGLPKKEIVERLKREDVFLIGTATTPEEARLVEEIGMDAVVVQGSEAGGHRGSFYGKLAYIPLNQLVKEVRETVQIPIIAAGGIANKKMIHELTELGAEAVQIGTALLVAEESGAHPLHKREVLQAAKGDTVCTNTFSGKMARGLKNEFIKRMENACIAPYPFQNTYTKDIRKASADQGTSDYMSLWAGENAYLSESGKVKAIIERFL